MPKEATSPNFAEKTFMNSHKTTKFAEVFSLETFSLYGTLSMKIASYCTNITCYTVTPFGPVYILSVRIRESLSVGHTFLFMRYM